MSCIQLNARVPQQPSRLANPSSSKAPRFAANGKDDVDDLLALHRLERRDGKLENVEIPKGVARDAATQLQLLATMLIKINQYGDAGKVMGLSNELYESILAKDPTGVSGNQVMRARLLQGQIKLFEGKVEDAKKFITEAREYFEKRDEKSLEMAEIFDLLEKIYRQLGGSANKREANYFAGRAKLIRDHHGIKRGWFG